LEATVYIRWVQLNGENTKYFHARATEHFRHNTIDGILSSDGVVLEDHQIKDVSFPRCFMHRMGVSFPPYENLNIHASIQPADSLHSPVVKFSIKEVEVVIKHINLDKAPGPNGFNGMFLKHCWHVGIL
jgi:hypothetical protein